MAVAGAFASHTPPAEGDSIACRKHRPGCRERAGHDGAPWGRQVRLDQGTCLFLLDALAPTPDEAPVFVDLLDAPAPAAAAPTSGPDASGDGHRQTPVSCRAAGSTAVCQGCYLSVAPTVPDARHMIQRAPSAPAHRSTVLTTIISRGRICTVLIKTGRELHLWAWTRRWPTFPQFQGGRVGDHGGLQAASSGRVRPHGRRCG